MTKRRPAWSDRLWQVAVLCGGLLLLNPVAPVVAAQQKPVAVNAAKQGKKPAARVARPGLKSAKKSIRQKGAQTARSPGETVGTAKVRAADDRGLRGSASFYGHGFQGRRVASGERYDVRAFTAASNHFPLGSWVAVRRLDNEHCAIVRINDRMLARNQRRVIDVSRAVAEYLDMIRAGVTLVRVAPLKSTDRAAQHCRAAFQAAEDCPDCEPAPDLLRELKGEREVLWP